ncbi:MAG: FAD-binding protein [bacterium]
MVYDIIIIGAGPAGSTLARLLGKVYNILLIDKRDLRENSSSRGNIKCCGGLLAPDAQKMLSKFGLGLPKSVLVDPQLFVVRAIDLEHNLERYYQRYYLNIDRFKFDKWLVSLIPEEVESKFNCSFKSYQVEQKYISVVFSQKDREVTAKTKILVGADGASSLVRRLSCGGGDVFKSYLSIQEWVKPEQKLPYFSTIFDSDLTDYYCWTIPKEDKMIIGGVFYPRENATEKFRLLKDKLRNYGYVFNNTEDQEGSLIIRPNCLIKYPPLNDNMALIGEAGGWIRPSSSEGLSYAFKSSLLLAGSLSRSFDHGVKIFRRRTKYLKKNLFFKSFKSFFIYSPAMRKIIMNSGLQSIRIYKFR